MTAYPAFYSAMAYGAIDFGADTICVALVPDSYTYNSAHSALAQVASIITGSGSPALANVVFRASGTGAIIDADNKTAFSAAGGGTYDRLAFYVSGSSIDWLIRTVNLDSAITLNGGNVALNLNPTGFHAIWVG